MKQHKELLIENLLKKSKNALSDANYALEDNRLETVNNRVYYAVFYSVMALGYKYDFITSKHSQLLGWFNKIIIHEKKLFEPRFFQIYKNAYEFRMKSDYEYAYKPVKEYSQALYNETVKFIDVIQNYLNKEI